LEQPADAHPQNGYDYYRLALVDIDGSRKFSPVKSVWIGQDAAFRIYPNPAGSRVTLQLPESATGLAVLYDASGSLVAQQEFSGNTVNFSLQGLPAGVYHLWALQNGKQYVGQVLH
jgi:Secretion system C-terminal sorting domain